MTWKFWQWWRQDQIQTARQAKEGAERTRPEIARLVRDLNTRSTNNFAERMLEAWGHKHR